MDATPQTRQPRLENSIDTIAFLTLLILHQKYHALAWQRSKQHSKYENLDENYKGN